ncbi:hypothetical protein BH11VER1_BH11VER1_05790 [soil metagenome]
MFFPSTRIKALLLVLSFATGAQAREWKDVSGRSIEAEMLGVDQGNAVVLNAAKQRVSLPLKKLSPADQAWVRQWSEGKSALQLFPAPLWSLTVQQPEVRVTGGAQKGVGFVFNSPHYEFRCDAEVSPSVMNDFATVAEGTLRLVYSLPVAFPALEGKTYSARILQSEEAYARAGGPAGSGGVFIASMSGDGVLLVPFSSLGIEQFAGRNTKGYDYSATVLIHEMVHQATGELLTLMPRWVSEGLAEYAANTIYRNGVFYTGERDRILSLRQRLEGYDKLTRGNGQSFAAPGTGVTGNGPARPMESWIMKPSQLLSVSEAAWRTDVNSNAALVQVHRLYLSSMFMMHYYLHLADNGDARRIRLYFQELNKASTYFRTRGKEGSLPEELVRQKGLTLDEAQDVFLKHLYSPSELQALDADFKTRFNALGFRL